MLCTGYAAQGQGERMVDSRVSDATIVQQQTASQAKSRKAAHDNVTRADTGTNVVVVLPSKLGNISVSARLDNDSIVIGDQTTLHIRVEGIGAEKVTLPNVQNLTKGAIEALESTTDTLASESGKSQTFEQSVTITSFDAGTHQIGGVAVKIDINGQSALLAPADSLILRVAYVAEADTTKCEMKADAGYIKEPLTFWEIVRWAIYALLLAAAAFAVIWIIKRRKEHKPIVVLPGAKPVPADRKALNELESLRRKELWQKGRIKKYYTDMTDIVRRFLRNMYGISAAEMTTRQTLRAFHGIGDWSEDSEALLRQLLNKADMVKFAKSQPEAYEHDQAMQYAVDFVRKVAETHRINNPEKEGDK